MRAAPVLLRAGDEARSRPELNRARRQGKRRRRPAATLRPFPGLRRIPFSLLEHNTNEKAPTDGREARQEAPDPRRRGEIRRLLRVLRRAEAQGRRGRPRLDHRGGDLPRLHARRALRLAAQDPAHQLLPVRLRLLRQPALLERAARAVLGRRGRDAHGRVLQAQLHRGPVPLLRHHPLARLHDGADAPRGEKAAPRPRLSRLHPPEDHPGGEPVADRAGGPVGRPAVDQPRTADRARASRRSRPRRTAPRSRAPWRRCTSASPRRGRSGGASRPPGSRPR